MSIGRNEPILMGVGGFVITASDTVDLVDDAGNTKAYEDLVYAVWVGGVGNVKVTTADGSTPTFNAVPAGTLLPVLCTRVWATGLTASALYTVKGA